MTFDELIAAPAMRYSFSGTIKLDPPDRARVERVIAGLSNGVAWGTGAARGVDTFACRTAFFHHPPATDHTIYVPSGGHNSDVVAWGRSQGMNVVNVPEGRHPYRPRNEALVDHIDPALTGEPGCLVAFPEGPYATHTRSGTWMTIHIAERRGVPVAVFDLKEKW